MWLGVNLFSAAAYHVYVKGMINRLAPSPTDMARAASPPPPSAPPPRQPADHSPPSQVLWNNLLSVPALAILGAILDRPGDLPRALSDLDGLGWLWVSSSMVVASAIAFTGFGMQKVPAPPLHHHHSTECAHACRRGLIRASSKYGRCSLRRRPPWSTTRTRLPHSSSPSPSSKTPSIG